MKKIIVSKTIYPPSIFLEGMTGKYYLPHNIRNDYVIFDIDSILRENRIVPKHFAMDEIEKAIEKNVSVVLVDCSHYVGEQYINEYHWYRVTDNFEANLSNY